MPGAEQGGVAEMRDSLERVGYLAGESTALVAYLASDEAGWVTGTTLHVNGGMAMI